MRPNLWADRIYLSKMWHTPENPRSSVDAIKQPQSSCLFSKLVCLWMFSLNTFNKSKVCNKDYSTFIGGFYPPDLPRLDGSRGIASEAPEYLGRRHVCI